jgi:hypothetical protein
MTRNFSVKIRQIEVIFCGALPKTASTALPEVSVHPVILAILVPILPNGSKTNTAIPHRMLVGRRTYEALAGLPSEVRDDGWQTMTSTPGCLFSSTLETTDWPALKIVRDDLVDRI